jgi:hypothetical protein
MICWCCVSLFLGVSLFSFCTITDIVWVLCGIKCITVGVSIREGLMSYSKSTPVSGCIPFQQPAALPSVRVWGCYRSISNLYNDLRDNSGGNDAIPGLSVDFHHVMIDPRSFLPVCAAQHPSLCPP